MKTPLNPSSLIIKNSTIEFVIVGPFQGKDRILVCSENAGLDLKGAALDPTLDVKRLTDFNLLGKRKLNVIGSRNYDDLNPSYDSRHSSYRFAWVGESSTAGMVKIQKALDVALSFISKSIERSFWDNESSFDENDIVMALSPLIIECLAAHRGRRRNRLFVLTYVVITILTSAAVALLGFLSNTLKIL
ncbi:hypothetical protein ACXAAV_12770 [Vibrio coralliilyticus]